MTIILTMTLALEVYRVTGFVSFPVSPFLGQKGHHTSFQKTVDLFFLSQQGEIQELHEFRVLVEVFKRQNAGLPCDERKTATGQRYKAGGWRQLRKTCLELCLPELGEEDGGELITKDQSNSGKNRNGYYSWTMESNLSLL